MNPSLMLSAQVAPWFQPFASAERTMRGPNPQEVFFSNDGGASMNPFLKGEKATTYQLGFNSSLHGLLSASDALNFKALYFKSKIDGYITSQSFLVCDSGRKCNIAEVIAKDWQNVDEYVTNMYIYINSATPGIHGDGNWKRNISWGRPMRACRTRVRRRASPPRSPARGLARPTSASCPVCITTSTWARACWTTSWKWAPSSSTRVRTAACRRTMRPMK
ncbi:TonB-dependent receptor [Janthinobacterium lividum]|nr:TonB-dependent receptor [Janthinobacterium lividum]